MFIWSNSCIESVLAVLWDEVYSDSIWIMSKGTSPDNVENSEGLLEKWYICKLSRSRIWVWSFSVKGWEISSLLELRIVDRDSLIMSSRGLAVGQIVQFSA